MGDHLTARLLDADDVLAAVGLLPDRTQAEEDVVGGLRTAVGLDQRPVLHIQVDGLLRLLEGVDCLLEAECDEGPEGVSRYEADHREGHDECSVAWGCCYECLSKRDQIVEVREEEPHEETDGDGSTEIAAPVDHGFSTFRVDEVCKS